MIHRPYFFLLWSVCGIALIVSCQPEQTFPDGYTEITRWKDGKKAAVSLTYDGGTINQFEMALPVMNRLGFPATFFIVTGEVDDSQYERMFIGRPVEEIVSETKRIATSTENFFERASAIRVLGDDSIIAYHTRAGDLWETGKFAEAYKLMDEAFIEVREAPGLPGIRDNQAKTGITWSQIKDYASQGHEFASHSVSHAQFGILDDVNLIYELEKSREEILNHLGPEHTFSIECPYGTENERVMDFTLTRYEAARNRMPEPFLEEINRWNRMDPGNSAKEYVQWQRGPKSDTPLEQMTSWIDTCTANDNIWLVLVFHGIEGIGWEPIPGSTIEAYFNYIKSKEPYLWVATFQDATKYMRERMHAKIEYMKDKDQIRIRLFHDLDPELYNLPLTLKTYLPPGWDEVEVSQGKRNWSVEIGKDAYGRFVQYESYPNAEEIILNRK